MEKVIFSCKFDCPNDGAVATPAELEMYGGYCPQCGQDVYQLTETEYRLRSWRRTRDLANKFSRLQVVLSQAAKSWLRSEE